MYKVIHSHSSISSSPPPPSDTSPVFTRTTRGSRRRRCTSSVRTSAPTASCCRAGTAAAGRRRRASLEPCPGAPAAAAAPRTPRLVGPRGRSRCTAPRPCRSSPRTRGRAPQPLFPRSLSPAGLRRAWHALLQTYNMQMWWARIFYGRQEMLVIDLLASQDSRRKVGDLWGRQWME